MTHPVDVPPAVLLPRLAEELRSRPGIAPPGWAAFAKTGVHKSKAPATPDWWWVRSASLLRKIHLIGPIGVEQLASEYGGKRDRGSKPYHARSGSRSITREIIAQLEGAGLVRPEKNRGRMVTADGQRMLDRVARETLKALAERRPELAKYL